MRYLLLAPLLTTKLAVMAASLLMADMALATSIGINFVDIEDAGVQNGTQDALAPGELAGAHGYQQVNWNNLGRWGAGDSAAFLKDSSGAASGVTATWDSNNTWRTGAGFATADHKLMHGYLDATGQANVDAPYQFFSNENKPQAYATGLSAWLTAQGASHYDVVVYIDGDVAEGRIGEYWLQAANHDAGFVALGAELTSHVFVRDSANFSGAYTQAPLSASSLAAAADGNYVVFTGLTANNFVLRTEEQTFRAPINGLQIVAATGNPVVSTWVLGAPTGSGTGNWNDAANWSTGLAPNVANEDIATINGGGTAQVNSPTGSPTGSVVLGQGTAPGESGTLEILSGGDLTVVDDPTFPADGSVRVGQNAGQGFLAGTTTRNPFPGTGTLRVGPLGTLNCVTLTLGGTASSSITLGGPGAGTATVNAGAVSLGRTTRVIGPNVNFTSSGPGAGITFQDTSVFIPEITGPAHSALKTTGKATLGGMLQPDFVGVTPVAGQSWIIIDAASVTGAFDNAASGERVTTIDGVGSFVVHYGVESPFDPNKVVLSAFRFSADFDEDGDVDGDDLSQWRGDLGVNGDSDADNDGDSDGDDLLAWQRQLSSISLSVSANVAVTEPMTWMLMTAAAVGIGQVRKWRGCNLLEQVHVPATYSADMRSMWSPRG